MEPITGLVKITKDDLELSRQLSDSIIIDIRDAETFYKEGSIPGAVNLPAAEVDNYKDVTSVYSRHYIVSEGGMASIDVAMFLYGQGLTVFNLEGGVRDYATKYELEVQTMPEDVKAKLAEQKKLSKKKPKTEAQIKKEEEEKKARLADAKRIVALSKKAQAANKGKKKKKK